MRKDVVVVIVVDAVAVVVVIVAAVANTFWANHFCFVFVKFFLQLELEAERTWARRPRFKFGLLRIKALTNTPSWMGLKEAIGKKLYGGSILN